VDETTVAIGCRVEVELLSHSEPPERLAFTLVEDRQADFRSGFLAATTPLAQAILGHTAGETLPYRVGDLTAVRLLSVTPGEQAGGNEAAARRKAAVDKAVKHSDYVNAMIFAGSVNSKWGDYDIGALDPSQWEARQAKDGPAEANPDPDEE